MDELGVLTPLIEHSSSQSPSPKGQKLKCVRTQTDKGQGQPRATVVSLRTAIFLAVYFLGFHSALTAQPPFADPQSTINQRLLSEVRSRGTVRVIVGLNMTAPFRPEGSLASRAAVNEQRAEIARAQLDLLAQLTPYNTSVKAALRIIPFVAMEVDEAALGHLIGSARVSSLREDKLLRPTLGSSIPVIGADDAWAEGYEGEGQAVAILDTGVQASHPFFGGRVVWEGCYSTNYPTYSATTVCPNGQTSMTGPGAAAPCSLGECYHGTHVAGIAAGSGATIHGVARQADIIAIQVFSRFDSDAICGTSPCALSFNSDQLRGLEAVYDLRTTYNIAAANLSLGGGYYTDTCDGADPAYTAIIDTLRSVGIATVISSGNENRTNGTNFPGCITNAVTVGGRRTVTRWRGFRTARAGLIFWLRESRLNPRSRGRHRWRLGNLHVEPARRRSLGPFKKLQSRCGGGRDPRRPPVDRRPRDRSRERHRTISNSGR